MMIYAAIGCLFAAWQFNLARREGLDDEFQLTTGESAACFCLLAALWPLFLAGLLAEL